MTNRLVAVLTATTFLVSGAALAAEQGKSAPTDQTRMPPALAKAEHDLGKVSRQGSLAYQDISLARLAIFEGQTDQAKKLASAADVALAKAKTDETAFAMADRVVTGASTSQQAGGAQANEQGAPSHLWLPVYSTIELGEGYAVSPEKNKAVADANAHLRKGDREGAFERLRLADVDMSVVQALLPLQQTIGDVHQAASMINNGNYYEGSQLLRKVEASARFDVASYKQGAKGHSVYSYASDVGQAAASGAPGQQAAAANGAEPPTAPDPQYAPMHGEPTLHIAKEAPVHLVNGPQPSGPAAGPEPYSAPSPQD